MSGSRSGVLSLYRTMLKESQRFSGYNYRMYAQRRIKDGFRSNKNETDSGRIKELLVFGENNLQIIRRQVTVGNLFDEPTLVIENNLSKRHSQSQQAAPRS